MANDYTTYPTYSELRDAARDYASVKAELVKSRNRLKVAVLRSAVDGIPDMRIAKIAGVSRQTVRTWLGRIKPVSRT